MSRITKLAKKENGVFQEPIPIGTSSQYVTVDDNKTITLKDIIGDYTKIPEGKISEAIKTLDEKQVEIGDASATEKGLMSSVDFKKINPQILNRETEDLNTIKTPGWYRILCDESSNVMLVKNVPNFVQGGQDSCWLEVQQIDNLTLFQRLRTYSGEYFERQYDPNTLWTAWKQKDVVMKGAYPAVKGSEGLVPAPAAGYNDRFLKGDGTWAIPVNTWESNTSSRAGYVENPAGAASKVWKTDASGNPGWRDEKDTTYSNMVGASASAAGKAGLVPAPAREQQNYLLQGNGVWVAPKKTEGGSTSGYLLSSTEHANLKSLTNSWSKHSLELRPPANANHGGYIDFHYNGSTAYTSRIIEDKSGIVQIAGKLDVTGASTVKSVTASGAVTVNGVLKAQRADSKENGHIVVVSSSATKGITYLLNSYQPNVLDVTGRWGATSGASIRHIAASPSDIRLKENIKQNTTGGLELINKIPLYEFDWKDSGKHQKIGFIADELEKIDPNLSIGDKTQDEDGNPIYKSVNTFYLQGFEVKAIQELSQQNDELRKEIDILKKEIEELKAK